MALTYSTYEAKAKFSEVLRKVRAGQRVVIAYRGEEIAEIRPLARPDTNVAKVVARLEDQGVVSRPAGPAGKLKPVARKRGALKRFLESRE
ncbi:MAG: type II toxin-antitoxin system prevent-host-death family antitoxin [Candidatus Rokubacteria bacterium]|nr:type II toxin-antitoxin system prevent-host-death family antitoxin [Candidatus Rokubacteria bacterium]